MLKFKADVKNIKNSIDDYDKLYRMEQYPNLPLVKIGTSILGVTLFGSLTSYWIFRSYVHNHISVEGAKIAKNIAESDDVKNGLKTILEDPELLRSVSNLSANIIQNILEDPITKEKLLTLLGELINDQSIQNLLVLLAVNFFSREEIQNKLSDVIVDLLGRQEVRNKLNHLIDEACSNASNRKIIADMLKDILSKKETSEGMQKLVTSFLFGA